MKTSRLAALAAASYASCAFLSGALQAQTTTTDPLAPAGAMTAFPTMVQTGTKPTLTWSIMHPARIGSGQPSGGGNNGNGGDGSQEMAVVNPPGTIIPTVDSYVTVQIIGTGVSNCQGGNSSTSPATDLRMSLGGGTYQQLFYGTQANVDSSKLLFIKKVSAGQTIDLGGRFVIGSGWSPFFTTRSSNLQVVLVTLSRKHPNNGHGNNLDGVDSSNPGQGKGGPNGAIDPSGGVDDEMR
ncbi:MAG: hypothetical protein EOP83_09120 [Verrucomicrobiaceae bacterium]|nr:MAG: hypothetical protein EOP83_09120 [Verrucomicrobiaceae bacterium]